MDSPFIFYVRVIYSTDEARARTFLDEQENRIQRLEASLQQATDEIMSTGRKSTNLKEVSDCIEILQRMHFRQIERLYDLMSEHLEDGVYQSVCCYTNEPLECTLFGAENQNRSIILSDPLDPVVETDNETDTGTPQTAYSNETPRTLGSLQTTTANSNSELLTPPTPNFQDLNLSAASQALITQQSYNRGKLSDALEMTAPASSRIVPRDQSLETHPSDEQFNAVSLDRQSQSTEDLLMLFYHNGEEEDDDGSTIPSVSTVLQTRVSQQRSAFLEDDDEYSTVSISKRLRHASLKMARVSNFSEDDDDCSIPTVSTVLQSRQATRKHGLDENDEQSIPIVSTALQARRTATLRSKGDENNFPTLAESAVFQSKQVRDKMSQSTPTRRPSHIEFESHNMPSPAQTNITMDMSVRNEAYQFLDTVLEEDASVGTTETPVLDRYRLDPDDQSPHGLVVVPNQRGSSKKKIKKVYRKSPYPKQPPTPRIDENAPLNLDESTVGSPLVAFSASRKPLTSIGDRLAKRLVALDEQDRRSLAPSLMYASAALVISPSYGETAVSSSLPFLRSISQSEYHAAPRLIHLQVSLDEVQMAVTALNDAIGQAVQNNRPGAVARVHVASGEIHRILESRGLEQERKRKNLIYALTFFQRLVMKIPTGADLGIVFAVVG